MTVQVIWRGRPPLRPLLAHGFGIRYDLPVPLYLYLLGAGAVVALTFVILGLFVRVSGQGPRYPRVSLNRAPILGRLVLSPWPRVVLGTLGSLVLIAIILTGLLGATDATGNPAEYLLWIYFWAGTVVVSGLVGNLYALLNPWSALYDLGRRLLRRPEGGDGLIRYPARLGIWPAVVSYLVFAWFELASGLSAKPRFVAAGALLYSVYTLTMMVLIGRDRWLSRGEVFSVLFRFVGAFGPVEVRCRDPAACARCRSHCAPSQTECVNCGECFRRSSDRDVALRPWAVGLLNLPEAGWDTVTFVILTLSSLAFDGLSATPLWASVVNGTGGLTEALGGAGPMLLKTLGLLAVTGAFLAIFAGTAQLVGRAGEVRAAGLRTSSLLAYTLVPIALVYNAAHNYSYMVIQGQGIIPLTADPLHRGAHLLPTSGYQPSFALADATLVWWVQIALIVLGHMLAVYLAHVRALTLSPTARTALRGQLPMLGLMVLYTMTSLWILAQPITEAG